MAIRFSRNSGLLELGTYRGAPIYLNPGFLILAAFLASPFWRHFSGRGLLLGLIFVGAVLVSILVHELAHAAAGRYYGVATQQIDIEVYGGTVRFLGFPHSRRQDFAITLAGPLSNLAIALAAIVVLVLLPAAQPDMIEIGGRLVPKPYVVPTIAERALRAVVYLNLALCIGNLLPGVPLDGGKLAYLLIEHRWNARVALLVVSALGLFFACLSMLFMLVTTLAGAPAFAPLDFKANIQAFQDARQGRGVWEDYVD